MFRTALCLTTALCAFPAIAEDFRVNAPVKAVTVYPEGATLTREFSVDVPEGRHRILLVVPEGAEYSGVPRIEGLGALTVGALEYLPNYVTDAETILNDAQTAALALLRDVEKQVQRDEDAVSRAEVSQQATSARIAFYRSVSASTVDELDVAALRDVGVMIGEELAQALVAEQDAIEAAREAKEALAKTRRSLVQAQGNFERLTPPQGPVNMLAVTVDAPEAASADLRLNHLIEDAYWSATYELDLDVESGRLDVARKVVVVQQTGELWSDVALTLSTADPFAQIDPREVYPQKARIVDRNQRSGFSPSSRMEGPSADSLVVEEPTFADPVIEETVASVEVEGLSITYDYPQLVSVAPGNGALVLALGGFDFDAEVFNRAAPRRDETAFLMARFTNDQSEPILPGDVQLYRDGNFVGGSTMEMVPAGEEATISFGALEGLRLEYRQLDNDTGDRGILTTSNTRRQQLEFSVKNLTAETETVETLFALPFTEQEDLSLKVSATPNPEETDYEKRRGVGKWVLEVGPGETKTVALNVDLSWPEGQELLWRP